MAVLGAHHDVLVDGGLVHAPGQQLVLAQAGAVGGGAGIAGTKGDVAGGVLVKQGVVEQLAAAVDGLEAGTSATSPMWRAPSSVSSS